MYVRVCQLLNELQGKSQLIEYKICFLDPGFKFKVLKLGIEKV